MGIRGILRKVFNKEKKIVICGLDNSGKTSLASFLKTGTFIEHTPTMGKELTKLEIQGVRINLMDMGGQRDFRDLWLGELSNAQCVIFMIDAHATERFSEAKYELWKLSSVFKSKPLIVLANKMDLDPCASIPLILKSLELYKIDSFEILPISCKTGYGIVPAFTKIYYKITGKQLVNKVIPKALTIFDKGGIPLTSTSNEDILQGGLFAAITNFVKESFHSELDQIKIEDNVIIFKRTKHLMGSIILNQRDAINSDEAEAGLEELLIHLENMCPELEEDHLERAKIEYLVKEYSTNIM
ncbi:MAG: ADP-ribosylation factor-like protein [Promethearchaeota archaeon]|jgi:ADP-ribosylation factor related protein 1